MLATVFPEATVLVLRFLDDLTLRPRPVRSSQWLAAGGLILTLLAACGGTPPPPAPPQAADRDLLSGWRLARTAFELGQYEQAAALYERVLAEAYARDDLRAIGDVGYELAVVQLREGITRRPPHRRAQPGRS